MEMNKYKTEYTIAITDSCGGGDVGVAVFDTYNSKEEAEADVKILESQYPQLRFSVEASEYLTD